MGPWMIAWLVVMAIGILAQWVMIILFALLAGREGPPALRGVKRWIEDRLRRFP